MFNSSPNDKILDWSKLKAFADDKINVTEKLRRKKKGDCVEKELTLSQMANFGLFQTLPDNNFKFDENGREFSKWLENTVEKREIVPYKQFLLFPKCFQMICTADT